MILTTFFLLLSLIANGQNLVNNGSFEREGSSYMKELVRTDTKIEAFKDPRNNMLTIDEWYQLSANYIAVESFEGMAYLNLPLRGDSTLNEIAPCVPIVEQPNVVVGLVLGHLEPKQPREYIFTYLKQPLEKGKTYKVGINVFVQSCLLQEGVDHIGIQLYDYRPNRHYLDARIDSTALKLTWDKQKLDQWQTLTTTYTAKGGETHIMVGDFSPDMSMPLSFKKSLKLKRKQKKAYKGLGFYLIIDSVGLYPMQDTSSTNSISAKQGSTTPLDQSQNGMDWKVDQDSFVQISEAQTAKSINGFMQQAEKLIGQSIYYQVKIYTALDDAQRLEDYEQLKYQEAQKIKKALINHGLDEQKIMIEDDPSAMDKQIRLKLFYYQKE